jgi:methionine synthase I (cobalamin-dependent)/5,10-methylenetetrahydrofolate reductase
VADFLDRLNNGPAIVADGGMGAIVSGAVPRLRCPEEANLRAPESVVALHASFIRAGAELIETNTFGANRRKLAAHYLEDELERINETGVKLAREARQMTGRDVFIAGSIGPLGLEEGEAVDQPALFAEQAQLLHGRGVDLFMVETFYDLDELTAAVEAVRGVSSLPIVALMTFDEDAETPGGVTAAEAATRLRELEVAAIGTNHGAGPSSALTALAGMGDGLPLAALPNVGLASISGGRVIYPHATPDYFAEFAAQAHSLGARLIGGCCGTTPTQIEAIASALAEERAPSAPFVVGERELRIPVAAADAQETQLARKLRAGEWVVSVQLDPPHSADSTGMLEIARALGASGHVDVVDVNDNATARAGMSALMVSGAIERVVGVETIPHLTTRDLTVMGLESALLGAHADGIRNVLAITGDPPEVGDYPGSRGVYEIDAIGLTQLLSRLNAGEDFYGKAIDAPTSFFIGVAVNPTPDDLDVELDRFERKLAAGAQFAMTQILFDFAYYDQLFERFGSSTPIPVLVGVFPLTSYRLALRLHNEVPGIIVPDRVQEALRNAGPNAAEVGFALARELIAEAREKAAGVYVVAPFRRPVAALDVLT